MENILQFFSIWQKLKVTVSPLFTAPRDFKFSETFFFTQCHITVNFATLRSEKVAYHPTLIYNYIVHWIVSYFGWLLIPVSKIYFSENPFSTSDLDCYLLPGPGSNVLPLWQFDQWPCCMPLQTKSADNNKASYIHIIDSIITNI